MAFSFLFINEDVHRVSIHVVMGPGLDPLVGSDEKKEPAAQGAALLECRFWKSPKTPSLKKLFS